MKDQRSFLYQTVPGGGLSEVLRVKQVSVDPVEEGSIKITGQDPSLSMRVGSMLPIRKYKESLSWFLVQLKLRNSATGR